VFNIVKSVLLCVLAVLAETSAADIITVPAETRIFGELAQEVTSNVEQFASGDPVMGRVWQDVVVDERTVISAGAPMVLRISDITKRKVFGRGGNVEVRAVSVTAVDGTEIFLDGGYDQEAENRIILTASLFALVAWPTAFIKGKEAILPPGTVFDATTLASVTVTVPDNAPRIVPAPDTSNLRVEVLYDAMTEDTKDLPLRLTLCGHDALGDLEITSVKGSALEEPLEIEVVTSGRVDGCHVVAGSVDLKDLGEHLSKGINLFTVSASGESADVLLDIEM
jgi:hypothetical protein